MNWSLHCCLREGLQREAVCTQFSGDCRGAISQHTFGSSLPWVSPFRRFSPTIPTHGAAGRETSWRPLYNRIQIPSTMQKKKLVPFYEDQTNCIHYLFQSPLRCQDAGDVIYKPDSQLRFTKVHKPSNLPFNGIQQELVARAANGESAMLGV